MSENTQLTSASGYDTKRMIFSAAQTGSIPNSVPQINFKRILISTRNPDGTVGDLILPTSKLFSFGVSENVDMGTGKVNGYVMPLCLWNRDGATPEEKEWSDTFNAIVERCKDHLVEQREEIEQYDLAKSDLKKFNPLYWKKERGKIVEGTGPTLYAKLIVSKKLGKILTMYYDGNGDSIDPMSLIGKYCYTKAAVKIESIFIGNKISLQVKLYECETRLVNTGMRRLMRPAAQTRVLTSESHKPLDTSTPAVDSDDDDAIEDSDDDTPAPPPPVKKKVVRRTKRVARK